MIDVTTVGYVYTGPLDSNAGFQRDLIRRHGAGVIYEDNNSTSTGRRPQLTSALDSLQSGDRIVVWRLDRLGSTSASVLALIHLLVGRGVAVASIDERFDTAGPDGAAIAATVAAFTQLERCLTRERTLAGVYAAKARGRSGGRPRALSQTNLERVMAMREQGASVREIAEELGTSRATIYRAIEAETSDRPPDAGDRSITISFGSPLSHQPRPSIDH